MLTTNDDRLKVEVKWVLKALASGRYELISNSDGDEPYLRGTRIRSEENAQVLRKLERGSPWPKTDRTSAERFNRW